MIQTLVQYFIKNGHLDLPAIGILKWSKQASFWENNKFVAPKEFIVLDKVEVTPSKQFYSFIAEDLDISIEQAILQFDQFIQQFKDQKMASLNFGNLGTLHKNESIISWNNLYNGDAYYKDLEMTISPVFEGETSDPDVPKDHWRIWTILLVIIAAALIMYKQL